MPKFLKIIFVAIAVSIEFFLGIGFTAVAVATAAAVAGVTAVAVVTAAAVVTIVVVVAADDDAAADAADVIMFFIIIIICIAALFAGVIVGKKYVVPNIQLPIVEAYAARLEADCLNQVGDTNNVQETREKIISYSKTFPKIEEESVVRAYNTAIKNCSMQKGLTVPEEAIVKRLVKVIETENIQ